MQLTGKRTTLAAVAVAALIVGVIVGDVLAQHSGGKTSAAASGTVQPAGGGAVSTSPLPPVSQGNGGTVEVAAPPQGFTLTWGDDFNGTAGSGLDRSTWRYDVGPHSAVGNETTTDSTDNVYQDGDGHLVIKATHSGSDASSGWVSGHIQTVAQSFGAGAGGTVLFQASIEQPQVDQSNGAGYWPAFWLLGPQSGFQHWPTTGEIDVLEAVNSRPTVIGTLHCGVSQGGPCREPGGIGNRYQCQTCMQGFHTYGVEIDRSSSPEQIRWYVDGQNYFSVSADRVDATTWSQAVDHAFYVIFDLAMGGSFPDSLGGGPNAGTAPDGMLKIDYVAVYNKGPAA